MGFDFGALAKVLEVGVVFFVLFEGFLDGGVEVFFVIASLHFIDDPLEGEGFAFGENFERFGIGRGGEEFPEGREFSARALGFLEFVDDGIEDQGLFAVRVKLEVSVDVRFGAGGVGVDDGVEVFMGEAALVLGVVEDVLAGLGGQWFAIGFEVGEDAGEAVLAELE